MRRVGDQPYRAEAADVLRGEFGGQKWIDQRGDRAEAGEAEEGQRGVGSGGSDDRDRVTHTDAKAVQRRGTRRRHPVELPHRQRLPGG